MPVKRIGDWHRASRLLRIAPRNLSRGMDLALYREAQRFRSEVVKGITRGAPGGKAFEPLSPITIGARRAARKSGRSGTKPLIDRGDMRRAITVQKLPGGNGYFVGLLRGRTNKEGTEWINIAATHEFGATVTLRLTDKHRRYLMMIMRKGGLTPSSDRPARQVLVVHIPPRPFLKPVADKLRPGMPERVLDQVGKIVLGV